MHLGKKCKGGDAYFLISTPRKDKKFQIPIEWGHLQSLYNHAFCKNIICQQWVTSIIYSPFPKDWRGRGSNLEV